MLELASVAYSFYEIVVYASPRLAGWLLLPTLSLIGLLTFDFYGVSQPTLQIYAAVLPFAITAIAWAFWSRRNIKGRDAL